MMTRAVDEFALLCAKAGDAIIESAIIDSANDESIAEVSALSVDFVIVQFTSRRPRNTLIQTDFIRTLYQLTITGISPQDEWQKNQTKRK
jgi:hypothetical protein